MNRTLRCFTIYTALLCFMLHSVWNSLENVFPEEHKATALWSWEGRSMPHSHPSSTVPPCSYSWGHLLQQIKGFMQRRQYYMGNTTIRSQACAMRSNFLATSTYRSCDLGQPTYSL